MEQRKLGRNGPPVAAIGFGAGSIGLADVYTSSIQDDEKAITLIHRALDLGITLLDTANVYGDSEVKVGKALKGRRGEAVLATKFGFVSNPARPSGLDGRPETVRRSCDLSLQRLGVDSIDLYYLHRVDPDVPIEETVGAMADLVRVGKVRHIGLSEAAPATVRRAHQVHPMAAVQMEYSLFTRDPEDSLLPVLRQLGIALVAYSPLGRGFLAGRFHSVDDLASVDLRRNNPRFQGEQFAKNVAVSDRLREVAQEKGCTPAQLALAWILSRHNDVIPIPGTSSIERLEENVRAADIRLSRDDLDRIERATPKGIAAGDRYPPAMMDLVNR